MEQSEPAKVAMATDETRKEASMEQSEPAKVAMATDETRKEASMEQSEPAKVAMATDETRKEAPMEQSEPAKVAMATDETRKETMDQSEPAKVAMATDETRKEAQSAGTDNGLVDDVTLLSLQKRIQTLETENSDLKEKCVKLEDMVVTLSAGSSRNQKRKYSETDIAAKVAFKRAEEEMFLREEVMIWINK
eukprot:g67593.t1